MLKKRRGVLILVTSLTRTGGIEQFNRRLACGAAEFMALTGEPVWMLSLLDSDPLSVVEAGGTLSVYPAGGSRVRFVTRAVGIGLRERPRVVFSGLVNFAPIGLALRLLGLVERSIVQLYGAEAWGRLPAHRRFALQRADVLASITTFTAKQAAEANGAHHPAVRMLMPVLDDSWRPEPMPRKTTRTRGELLTVARLDASEGRKGVDWVLNALASPSLRGLDWHYRVVGEGSDRSRLERLAKELGIDERVDFLGAVSTSDLHFCFQHCDVFLMPSTQEGFGIVFLEAAAYGKPVIGARSGGVPEVVADGETGILVHPGDDKGLTEAIGRLLARPDERHRMGSAGRSTVDEHFRPANFVAQLSNLLERPPRAARLRK